MSNLQNTELLDETSFYIDYFTGTVIGKLLEDDLAANDLEGLQHHLHDARATAFSLEFNPGGVTS